MKNYSNFLILGLFSLFCLQTFANDTIPINSLFALKSTVNGKYLTKTAFDDVVYFSADEMDINTCFRLTGDDSGPFYIQTFSSGEYLKFYKKDGGVVTYDRPINLNATTDPGSSLRFTSVDYQDGKISFSPANNDGHYLTIDTEDRNTLDIKGEVQWDNTTCFEYVKIPEGTYEIASRDTMVLDTAMYFTLKNKSANKYIVCGSETNDSMVFVTADAATTKASAFKIEYAPDSVKKVDGAFLIKTYNGFNLRGYKTDDGYVEYGRPIQTQIENGSHTHFIGFFYVDKENSEDEIVIESATFTDHHMRYDAGEGNTLDFLAFEDSPDAIFTIEFLTATEYDALADPGVPALIKSSTHQKLSIFPNPANDYLNVENGGISSFSIYNLQGQLCKTFTSTSRLFVGDLSSGIYFLSVADEAGNTHKRKFVKQ